MTEYYRAEVLPADRSPHCRDWIAMPKVRTLAGARRQALRELRDARAALHIGRLEDSGVIVSVTHCLDSTLYPRTRRRAMWGAGPACATAADTNWQSKLKSDRWGDSRHTVGSSRSFCAAQAAHYRGLIGATPRQTAFTSLFGEGIPSQADWDSMVRQAATMWEQAFTDLVGLPDDEFLGV